MATVTLRDDLQAWAAAQASEGGFASADEVVNTIVAEAKSQSWLDAELEKGFASGVDPRSLDQIIADIRTELNLPDADA